jgi:heptosyltransferase-1
MRQPSLGIQSPENVHTLPAVALVKRQWPDSRIRWVINPEWAPLLDGNACVDDAVIFPRRDFRGATGWAKFPRWLAKISREARSELVLDFQGLLRSALISRACRTERSVGLSDAREGARWFYDSVVDVSGHAHAVDRYLALIASLGIDIGGPLDWPLPPGTRPNGFEGNERFVLLHPFSRGAGKSLEPSQVREFCAAVPGRVALVGRFEGVAGEMGENVIDLLNRTTLGELIWLIRKAQFVVSVDSGPMHIAAAITSRLLSIHTWSDPRKVGPYRPEAWVLKDGNIYRQSEYAAGMAGASAGGMDSLAKFATRESA